MGNFIKCECPNCGQPIEYLSEGDGQTIPCPSCEKQITLGLASPQSFIAKARSQPATEKQKTKLRHFGYVLKEDMTKGEASDALDKCARDFPDVERAYYNRPATEEQLAKIQDHWKDAPDEFDGPHTYREAKDLIQEIETKKRIRELEEDEAYAKSDEARIDEAWSTIDESWEVTREQIAKAWTIAKSRMADGVGTPDADEIEDTLEEMFPALREKGPSYPVYRCKECGIKFKVRPPKISAFNVQSVLDGRIYSNEDIVEVVIQCPGCGRNKSVKTYQVYKCLCSYCSMDCLVVNSHIGQRVKCSGCHKDFLAAKSEPLNVAPRIRVMNYLEEPGR